MKSAEGAAEGRAGEARREKTQPHALGAEGAKHDPTGERTTQPASREWDDEDLDAPGTGRKAVVSLEDGSEEYEDISVLRSARTRNGAFLRQRILQRIATA